MRRPCPLILHSFYWNLMPFKVLHHFMHIIRRKLISPLFKLLRKSKKGFPHTCGNICQCIAVTTKTYRCSDYIFKVLSFIPVKVIKKKVFYVIKNPF